MLLVDPEDSNDETCNSSTHLEDISVHRVLNKQEMSIIRKQLEQYILTLHGNGRSCVGGITLATGFSFELIDNVIASSYI